jgi:phage baseplate assembly protein gpV
MAVPAVNLTLDKGTDFETTFNLTNSDGTFFSLTNYTATARVKKHPSSTTYKEFTTAITISTAEIKLTMSAANTALLTSGRNYYDVIITHTTINKKIKVFEGMILVQDTVSI